MVKNSSWVWREFLALSAYEFVIPNLSQIYFCMPEKFKRTVKSSFEFVLLCSKKKTVLKCSY